MILINNLLLYVRWNYVYCIVVLVLLSFVGTILGVVWEF